MKYKTLNSDQMVLILMKLQPYMDRQEALECIRKGTWKRYLDHNTMAMIRKLGGETNANSL